MAESIAHKAERKAFEVAIDAALKHVDKDREKAMLQFIDLMEKILGDTWSPAASAEDRPRGAGGSRSICAYGSPAAA